MTVRTFSRSVSCLLQPWFLRSLAQEALFFLRMFPICGMGNALFPGSLVRISLKGLSALMCGGHRF